MKHRHDWHARWRCEHIDEDGIEHEFISNLTLGQSACSKGRWVYTCVICHEQGFDASQRALARFVSRLT